MSDVPINIRDIPKSPNNTKLSDFVGHYLPSKLGYKNFLLILQMPNLSLSYSVVDKVKHTLVNVTIPSFIWLFFRNIFLKLQDYFSKI